MEMYQVTATLTHPSFFRVQPLIHHPLQRHIGKYPMQSNLALLWVLSAT